MAIIKTDDSHYQDIVDEINILLDEDIKSKPPAIAPRLAAIPKTRDKVYGRETPTFTLDKTEITLNAKNISDSVTVVTDSDSEIQVENPASDFVSIQTNGKVITFNKRPKQGETQQVVNINLLKNDHFKGASGNISLKYFDPYPHSTDSPLDKEMMASKLGNLTGTIAFSKAKAPTNGTVALTYDYSVVAKINGQDATVYSKHGGGVAAPWDSSSLFTKKGSQETSWEDIPYAATALNLDGLDTNGVEKMDRMFYKSAATILDLRSFNTSNVTSMSGMFNYSTSTTIDVSSFDTANVRDMSTMFSGSHATTLDLSSFETSNVQEMGAMFMSSSATTINGLSGFDTRRVLNMTNMFRKSAATTLDLSSFDTTKVYDVDQMFNESKATKVYCRTEEDKTKMQTSFKCSATGFVVGKPT